MSKKLRAVNLVIGLLLIGTLIAPLEGASPRVASAARQETRLDEPLAERGQIVQQLVDVPTFSGTTQVSYTIPDPPAAPPDDGPGGPILIISSASNPFTRYYTEILRTEGLNEFLAADVSSVDATVLSGYQVAILGEMTLTPAQVTMLTDWVNAGGNLIAMRPDPQLSGLLGLTATGATFSNGYLLVNTSTAPGAGIVDETIQYHDAADLYALNGATVIATLYSDSTTATFNPAVSLVNVGTNGGQAAAFTFDLAKSVVYTRQGNPAWKDINGDGSDGPVRADDMFHNGTDPDWVNLDKVAIPQADEQQRLLANLILTVNQDNNPLPRFWYFPHGEKAVVLLTSDDHGSSNISGMLDLEKALSPTNCSANDWECVRSSTYTFSGTALTQEQATAYTAEGFEIGVHVDTGCANYTLAELEGFYTTQLTDFAARFPALPLPASERTHCTAWSGWASQADVKQQKGLGLDTNYYFWPSAWVNDRPGLFTGSGMPMRFADQDGTLINVYQATTQMTDESGQTYPYTINTLLSHALAAEGYYGVFTANMHSSVLDAPTADAIIVSALANDVPVISGRQLLNWLDGRNSSAFANIAWSSNTLTFDITSPFGTRAGWLEAMVPAYTIGGTVSGIAIGGSPVPYRLQTIKGIQYAVFDARAGTVVASYAEDTTPPEVVSFSPANGATNVATSSAVTATFSEPVNATTINSNTFELRGPGDILVPATVTYNADSNTATLTPGAALNPNSSYLATLKGGVSGVTDMAGNPLAADATWSFATAADTSVTDFGASTANSCYIADTDNGEVILTPTEGTEFNGAGLSAGWEGSEWGPGGSVSVSGGHLTLSNGYARTTSLYGAGRALEFVATFSKRTTSQNQHAGFGDNLTSAPWAIFSTGLGGTVLKARSTGAADTDLGGSYLGSSHLYRIEWYADNIVYYIDGVQVADHAVSIDADMRPIASDGMDPATLSIDWMRMSPFVSQCSLTSRVFDAGETVIWDTMDWTGAVPTGASLALSYRIGNSPAPDAYWSDFVPVASSPSALGANSRYIQYKADLASTDEGLTPGLHDVSFTKHTASLQPPVLTAARSGVDVLLTWPHPGFGFDHYEVHRALAPYFSPDGSSFVSNVGPASAGTLEYPDIGRVGAGTAFFYVVVPIESSGWRHPASNRVGVFSFDLVLPPPMP